MTVTLYLHAKQNPVEIVGHAPTVCHSGAAGWTWAIDLTPVGDDYCMCGGYWKGAVEGPWRICSECGRRDRCGYPTCPCPEPSEPGGCEAENRG